MDVGRAIEPAFRHMLAMLFQPFSLRKWLSLGFVHLVAYGFSWTSLPGPGDFGGKGEESAQWLLQYLPMLVAFAVVIVALLFLFGWIASVLQFVYVNDIAQKSGAIAEPFKRLRRLGTSYFLWQLAFVLTVVLVVALVVVLPVVVVFALGWGTTAKVVSIAWAIIVGLITLVSAAVVGLFARDFVVPVMYARSVRVVEGWRIVLPLLRANAGQVCLYVLLVIAIGVALGFLSLLVALLLLAVFAIPILALGVIGYLIWTALDLIWTTRVIVVLAITGTLFVAAYLYAVECAMQPAHVFRRAYSMAVIGQTDPALVTIPTGLPADGKRQTGDTALN